MYPGASVAKTAMETVPKSHVSMTEPLLFGNGLRMLF